MRKTVLNSAICCVLALVACATGSCKKDSNSAGSSSTMSLLTKSVWTFQKFNYEKTDGTWIADPDAVDANQFTVSFNANGSYTEIDTRNGTTVTAHWTLSSGNTVLTLSGGYNTDAANYTISQINSTTMVLIEPKTAGSYEAVQWTYAHN